MEPIFSREAQVVGWLHHNVIHDETGRPRAFVRGEAVFALDAQYLGRLAFGFFRDEHGDAVAFMRGASGGPITPQVRVIPGQPKAWDIHVMPEPRVLAKAATPTLMWSELDWDAFLEPRPAEDLPSSAALTDERADLAP